MRTVSSLAKAELNKSALVLGDAWLWIVQIVTETTTIYLTENKTAIVFGGNTYQPFRFTLNLPNVQTDGLQDGSMVLDHTDLSIYNALVSASKPTIKVGLVLGAQNTVTELNKGALATWRITHRAVDEDANTISLTLSMDLSPDEIAPAHSFDQKHFLQLFIKQDLSKVTT